jgi:hypothetical protein
MMLPAREFPEEDPARAGLEGTAETPVQVPANSGTGVGADKTADSGSGVQAGRTAEAGNGVQAGRTAEAGNGMQAGRTAEAGSGVQAGRTAEAGSGVGVQAGKTALGNAGMVAYDSPSATASSPEAGRPAVAHGPAVAGFPASDVSANAAAGREWSDVLALFVDDPHGSVVEASAMVDEAINALIATARGRQASLAAAWQAKDADTEQLRSTRNCGRWGHSR